jgi:hypothetical protein
LKNKKENKKENELINSIIENFRKEANEMYIKNFKNTYKGLFTKRIEIRQDNEDLTLFCSFKNSQYLYLGDYNELHDNYLKSFKKIIKNKNVSMKDGYFVCSVEEFHKKFNIEEMSHLIALSVETCDCMCSYSHFSALLK